MHMSMRLLLSASVFLLASCSSTPQRAKGSPDEEKHAAKETDECLDNPELAKSWGDCNVKHTLYLAAGPFAECRERHPLARGTVSFELAVKGDGSVRNAKARDARQSPKLVRCLSGAMRKLRFAPPPGGREAKITVPYQLD